MSIEVRLYCSFPVYVTKEAAIIYETLAIFTVGCTDTSTVDRVDCGLLGCEIVRDYTQDEKRLS